MSADSVAAHGRRHRGVPREGVGASEGGLDRVRDKDPASDRRAGRQGESHAARAAPRGAPRGRARREDVTLRRRPRVPVAGVDHRRRARRSEPVRRAVGETRRGGRGEAGVRGGSERSPRDVERVQRVGGREELRESRGDGVHAASRPRRRLCNARALSVYSARAGSRRRGGSPCASCSSPPGGTSASSSSR